MTGPPAGQELTKAEKKTLLDHNVAQFAQMDRDAGNMVKQLLWELQSKGRNTYIALRDPEPGGAVIFYSMRQGTPQLIVTLAETLGFTSCDHQRLEV